MGRPAILKVDIVADAKGVKQGVDDADKHFAKLGSSAHKAGVALGVGVAVAGAAAVKFGADSVKAFVEAQQSANRLNDAYKRFPKTNDVTRASFDKLNSTLATKTRFDDDALASGQSVLAQYKLTGSQIQQLTPLLADYAAKTGKDIPEAAGVLGKALLGKGKALAEVGVKFKDAGSIGANYTQIMGGLRTQVGGFAQQEGKTAAGQAAILANRWGEMKEAVGAKLLPILTRLAGFLTGTLLPAAGRLASHLREQLAPTFARIGAYVHTNVVPALQRLGTFARTQLVPALQRLGGFIRANVLPVLAALGQFVVQHVIPAFRAIAERIIPAVQRAFANVNKHVQSHREQFAKLKPVLDKIGQVIQVLAPIVGTVLADAFKVAGDVIGGIIDTIARVIDAIDSAIGKIKDLAGVAKSVGGFVGKLNPFSAPIAPMGVPLVGGSDLTPSTHRLATAAFDVNPGLTAAGGGRGLTGGLVVIDNRRFDMPVRVDGALDAPNVARQLEQILRDHATRLGRATAYTGAMQ